jgi:hypothetical protein
MPKRTLVECIAREILQSNGDAAMPDDLETFVRKQLQRMLAEPPLPTQMSEGGPRNRSTGFIGMCL